MKMNTSRGQLEDPTKRGTRSAMDSEGGKQTREAAKSKKVCNKWPAANPQKAKAKKA